MDQQMKWLLPGFPVPMAQSLSVVLWWCEVSLHSSYFCGPRFKTQKRISLLKRWFLFLLNTESRFTNYLLSGTISVRVTEGKLTTYSKTSVSVSLVWMMSWRSTMFECFRPFRRDAADTEQKRWRRGVKCEASVKMPENLLRSLRPN